MIDFVSRPFKPRKRGEPLSCARRSRAQPTEKIHMTTVNRTRRSFLSTMAIAAPAVALGVVPALARPDPAPTPGGLVRASQAAGDDAELIELGGRFDEALVIHCDYQAREAAIEDAAPSPPCPAVDWHGNYDAARAEIDGWFKLDQAARERSGLEALAVEHGDFAATFLDPIVERIRTVVPTTLAGLAVKARIARFVASDWWIEDGEPVSARDLDLNVEVARALIDDLLTVAVRAG